MSSPKLGVRNSVIVSPSLERQARLLATGKYSDFTIVCQGKRFELHKAIVCEQSKPLAAAVKGLFLEASTGVITLDDNELDAFERLVELLYNESYHDTVTFAAATTQQSPASQIVSGTPQGLIMNVKVYVLAEKYDIPALKKYAADKYKKALPEEWNTETMAASLKILYENTPESDRLLKDIALKFVGNHVAELLCRGEFFTLCKESNDICLDLLKEATRISKDGASCGSADYLQVTCGNCNELQSYHGRKRRLPGRKDYYYQCEHCNFNLN